MQRRLFLWLVLVLLLALVTPVAFAQGISGDKVVFNQTYTLAEGEVLIGNLAAINSVVSLAPGSAVHGDVAAFGSTLTADGTILGSVAVFGGRVALGDSAVVAGDFAVLGGSITRAPGAVIRGEALMGLRPFAFGDRQIPAPTLDVRPPLRRATGFLERFIGWQLRTLGLGLLLALLGVAALLIAPKGVGRIASAAATQTAVSFGLGLLTLLLAIFAGALLLIACGLGLLVWLALVVGLLLGWIGVGLWVGQRLLAALRVQTTSSVAEIVLGIFLITVLGSLPFCTGFPFWLILASIGLGAAVMTRFGTQAADDGVPVEAPPVVPAASELLAPPPAAPEALDVDVIEAPATSDEAPPTDEQNALIGR